MDRYHGFGPAGRILEPAPLPAPAERPLALAAPVPSRVANGAASD